jgi:signal transduction histidine kinase
VVVRDNGPGLPDGIKGDPFTWTESAKPDGMGIGLSICRTIAESHSGAITLDSTGPAGSSFTLSLPAFEREITNQPVYP